MKVGGKALGKGGKAIGSMGSKLLGGKSEKGDKKSIDLLGPMFRKKHDTSSVSSVEFPEPGGRRKSQDSSGKPPNEEWVGGIRDTASECGSKAEISTSDDVWDDENDVEVQGLSAMKLSAVLEPICQILLEVFDFKEKTSFLKRNSALILFKQWWGIKEGRTIEMYFDSLSNARSINEALNKLIEEERIVEFLDMTEIKQEEPNELPLKLNVESTPGTPVQPQRFPSTTRRKSVFAESSSSSQFKKETERRKSLFSTFRQNRANGSSEIIGNVKIETREKLVSILPDVFARKLGDGGSEGVTRLFAIFQSSVLNKQLAYCLIDDFVETLLGESEE